jgi:hypothetical protein
LFNFFAREFIGYSDKDSTKKKVLHDVWKKGERDKWYLNTVSLRSLSTLLPAYQRPSSSIACFMCPELHSYPAAGLSNCQMSTAPLSQLIAGLRCPELLVVA